MNEDIIDPTTESRPAGQEPRIIRLVGAEAPEADCGSHRRPLFDGLRDRRIVQWFVGYLAMAWLALQLMQTLADIWSVPISIQRGVSLMLAFGTLPTLVVAWYHGELGRQRVCVMEVGIVAAMLLTTLAVVWRTCFI